MYKRVKGRTLSRHIQESAVFVKFSGLWCQVESYLLPFVCHNFCARDGGWCQNCKCVSPPHKMPKAVIVSQVFCSLTSHFHRPSTHKNISPKALVVERFLLQLETPHCTCCSSTIALLIPLFHHATKCQGKRCCS